MHVLRLKPVNIDIGLPAYKIVDSSRYGDGRTILNYKIMSKDSLLQAIVFIDDYKDYTTSQQNLERIAAMQKEEVESGQNTQKLIVQSISEINNVKVGYLKYIVEQTEKKFYAGRIFFYRENKLVVIWLFEEYRNDDQNNYSICDCILQSIIPY